MQNAECKMNVSLRDEYKMRDVQGAVPYDANERYRKNL